MARAKKPKKRTFAELPPEPDPRAPIDAALLVAALQPLREDLEQDLLARAKQSPAITAALRARHADERQRERTADDFASWQRRFVEQVAAAWILSCVFVRTLEDRGLLAQRRIAGPGAMDAQRTFLQLAPSLSEREYLLTTFREMTRLPAAAGLFDARHDPAWMLAPSAEGARALLAFFRTGGDEAPALRFGQPDTRFLGDLYQDLNEDVRKRYALLQTPAFVERFILDRTLEPAIERFGLDDADLCDPTCGSGHFLLGAFDRFYAHLCAARPALSPREGAHAALDKVYGADINPYAVAIARFRLTLSFLDKGGYARLADAPQVPLHVAVADSLLYNPQHGQRSLFHQDGVDAAAWERRAFDLEDEAEARAVLHREYAAVVGNPPYITVKDAKLRDRYRALYASASGKYSLSVPFCERFFQLAKPGGRTGQITANSFMKREFGKKLIEDYLPTVDLDLVVNTSGAYIPGHGTPTVLLFGAHQPPSREDVLAVLAKRGEPTTPDDPAEGLVWSSIAGHWDDVGHEDDYVSVARVERASLAAHPWSLGGGGASELKELLEERAETTLGQLADSIGIASFTLEDDVFLRPEDAWARIGVTPDWTRPMVIGEAIRDWSVGETPIAFFPYDDALRPVPADSPALTALWRWKTCLGSNKLFGGKTKVEGGLEWYEYGRLTTDKLRTPLTITFAFVATHNHFVLDRGGKVFKQSAPIIKLPATATEDDHLALLAYLNSSTACFWMKQVMMNKGATSDRGVLQADEDKFRYEFDATKLKLVPLPPHKYRPELVELARLCDGLAASVSYQNYVDVFATHGMAGDRLGQALADVDRRHTRARARLVALQEEIDWLIYGAFDLTGSGGVNEPRSSYSSMESTVGSRAFESADGVDAVSRARRAVIDTVEAIRLLETSEFKRRWYRSQGKFSAAAITDESMKGAAAEDYTAHSLERALRDHADPVPANILAIASGLPEDQVDSVVTVDSPQVVLENHAVPYLAALRYTDSGMDVRAAWERTWDLQRREDAGEHVCAIPVPPKYAQKDFRSPTFWRLRGKLDVPKERFISYPGCESDEDGDPVYGWAGWDHAQRAQALVTLYQDRKTREGWDKDRLTPMLAGLLELLPWLEQWHHDRHPDFDQTAFEAYAAFLDQELREHALTRDDLRTWRPAEKKGRKRG